MKRAKRTHGHAAAPAVLRPRTARGFSLIEVIIAGVLVALASMAAVAYVTRGTQQADWVRDKVHARQRALSILSELRAFVEGGEGEVAADLDGFDDGLSVSPSLTITPDPNDPGAVLPPDHPVSGNVRDHHGWRWHRRITVRRFPGVMTRDLRICTVRMYRMRDGDIFPGEEMAEVSSVIRTIGESFPTTQVYDVYLLALANAPGWWVYMDAIQPFIEATLADLESRNPGLKLRTHWITKLGYGRDEEYAPYVNEERDSLANTPWTYVYPGRMPAGESAQRYYVARRMQSRVNVDGEWLPQFQNVIAPQEPYTDTNGNGRRDPGEPYTDLDGDDTWDVGNPVPFAMADMHNHCMRYPEAVAKANARVAAGTETDDTPTWRLLLDRMIAEPDRYHNAILINLHGELMPLPPARNVSDAAKDPELKPGWRVVTHPERLAPRRVPGDDAASDTPRFRVYAYKTEFTNNEALMTQREPFVDVNKNGMFDGGETFEDWNGNGRWDDEMPLSIVIPGGNFAANPNAVLDPSIRIQRLPGGIDGDGDGNPDDYVDWQPATVYPERFADTNGDNIRQAAEVLLDLNGDGIRNGNDVWQEVDGDGKYSGVAEALVDLNSNGVFDAARPAESFTDTDGDGRWDAAEPYWDADTDGAWTAPTSPVSPWRPWDPLVDDADGTSRAAYIKAYGEPFVDIDNDKKYTPAEPFTDSNGNGVRDGGYARGEMWYDIRHESASNRTVLTLHGTPLSTPYVNNATNSQKGLPDAYRLYDLDYVPCPTPAAATDADRFARDLFTTNSGVPKNTARWIIELPLAQVRRTFETTPGAGDGDAADRTIAVETRIGTDLTTGVMWPTRRKPQNVSRTYAWFVDDPEDVPFSERYQFLGDPRHSPYADTDRQGTTAPHGYNWYFDNFTDGASDERGRWLAFDGARLRDRWLGRAGGHDLPRLFSWLRTAVSQTEAVYTTLTGWSYYYLSVGGDVGYDSANGFANSIPMDGKPFGLNGDVFENTLTDGGGTDAIKGSIKYVRSNDGAAAGIRTGGYWWSKPWLGELFQDSAYTTQWVPWGNLRADTGTTSGEYRLVRRGDLAGAQQPRGTTLRNAYNRTQREGCTSMFNVGTSSNTFHHQSVGGGTGGLVQDGVELALNYNFPLPTRALISRPFGLAASGSGGVGDEFSYTDAYPRYLAQMVTTFYDHTNGQTGSGLVRLQEPGADPRGGFIVVNGIDRTTESGSAFIARYSLLSLLHSYFAAGTPGGANRIRQLPRLQIESPTIVSELLDPSTIEVQWTTDWSRWDGMPYTTSYPNGFTEDESDLRYVLMYSVDNGDSWKHMLDDSRAEPGVLPWIEGVGPDPAKVLTDMNLGADESWSWPTPSTSFPEGSYVIRIEGYRASESLHFVQHMEKIYVKR
ncbi:MAG: hypothetical protein QNJ90_01400 [Planctomycetota bacterium]|nr:hypothetical protein [Planctomycetota bacterium]